jgi:hypothetical protein
MGARKNLKGIRWGMSIDHVMRTFELVSLVLAGG